MLDCGQHSVEVSQLGLGLHHAQGCNALFLASLLEPAAYLNRIELRSAARRRARVITCPIARVRSGPARVDPRVKGVVPPRSDRLRPAELSPLHAVDRPQRYRRAARIPRRARIAPPPQ